ncbi:MAG: Wzz/FepE/Etk N-terminal domain-containing protein, partial [Flavobacteriales bacterium]
QKTNFVDADDLLPVIKFISKNWYLFILFSVLGYVFATIYTHRLPNIYGAKTDILLKSSNTYDYQNQIHRDIGYYNAVQDISNQKRILTSYDMIAKVLDKLDFTISYYLVGRIKTEQVDRFAFFTVNCDWRKLDPRLFNLPFEIKVIDLNKYRLSYLIGDKKIDHEFEFGRLYEDVNFSIQLDLNPGIDDMNLQTIQEQNFQFKVSHPNSLISKFKSSLVIENEKLSSVISLKLNHDLESRAKIFLDTLAKLYIDYTTKNEVKINFNTENYIDKQIEEVSQMIDSLEAVVQNFKDDQEIIDYTYEERKTMDALFKLENLSINNQLRKQQLQDLEEYLERERDLT